jgi:hypothetical protein
VKRGRDRPTPDSLRRNSILGALSSNELDEVARIANLVELEMHEQIFWANQRFQKTLFPLDSTVSVVLHMREGTTIEVATIGREGAATPNLLLGGEKVANDCHCLLPGSAVELSAEDARRLLSVSFNFREGSARFLRAYLAVLSQFAGCNRLHSIYQRSARWLLLSQDRAARDRIPLTHEYLAMMLGSRRSGVSLALAKLKERGAISYGPRYVTIIDRRGLLDATCECYAIAREHYGSVPGLIASGA